MVALIIVSSYLASYFNFILLYHIIALILLLIIVLTFDSWFRKRLLPRGKPKSEIALKLQQLKVRWIIRRKGRGVQAWNRVELGLPRTIADTSLEEKLSTVIIPNGLIEPEQIRSSKPGSLLGCIVGVAFSIFIIWAMFLNARTPFPAMTIYWVVIFLFLWNILRLILGLPAVHRSRKLPAFLRSIGRGRLSSRPIVVGPGWVKLGKTVWRGDRDMFFIRRTGFRLASSEIDCMFAGPEKRMRMTFSGVGDDDFQLLFGAWNVDDVRIEFVDSELS
ncbi:MAG: hypothetical protein ISR75_04220 [Phycisphaerales bacterium]|nr:hypothetical protein [Planctomycetota bacterium]MBL6997624.1 hypothetical protein [Phycisphaerales bacterium]